MSWRIHREMVLLLGWGRAILLQFAHPLVAAGVADHSGFLTEPFARWRRLHGTLGAMLALTFGSPEETARVARHINGLHDRVHGVTHEGAGRFAAGTRYSAHDAELLGWVHATLLDSFLLAYPLFVGPLTPAERDRYCAEATAIGPLLGIPDGLLPDSTAALDAYMARMLASGDIAVTDAARGLAREVIAPRVSVVLRPAFAFLRLATVGLLPPTVRAGYGYSWTPERDRVLRCAARLIRGALWATPSVARHWPAARAAERREARTERRLS